MDYTNQRTFGHDDDGVVVVIGSGAGGGTLANGLAQQGIKVVLLEAGGLHSRTDFHTDEWRLRATFLARSAHDFG